MTIMIINIGKQSGAFDDMLHNIAEQNNMSKITKIDGLTSTVELI